VFLRSVLQLLVTDNCVSATLILSNLMMEEISSSETSVLKRTTWRHIPDSNILQQMRKFEENVRMLKYFKTVMNLEQCKI
jgi:hypothetical protein